jgi:creatinine amidohydrolase
MVAPPGFEPRSGGPEPPMLDHYTTGLCVAPKSASVFFIFSVRKQTRRFFYKTTQLDHYDLEMPLWSELTHGNFKEIASETEVVVMVTGALEAHGKHLPLGTDTILPDSLGSQIAKRTNALVLPAIPFGESWSFDQYDGTISIQSDVLTGYYESVMRAIFKHGFHYVVVLNGHGGNDPILRQAARKATQEGERTVVIVNWWRDLAKSARELVEETPGGHAAEDETSEVMHVRPDLVDMTVAEAHRIETRFTIVSGAYRKDLLPSAVYGDPRKASEEKGKVIMEQAEKELVELINQLEQGQLPVEKTRFQP